MVSTAKIGCWARHNPIYRPKTPQKGLIGHFPLTYTSVKPVFSPKKCRNRVSEAFLSSFKEPYFSCKGLHQKFLETCFWASHTGFQALEIGFLGPFWATFRVTTFCSKMHIWVANRGSNERVHLSFSVKLIESCFFVKILFLNKKFQSLASARPCNGFWLGLPY